MALLSAEELFKAQRYRELVGVVGTNPADIKAACRRALLKHHPDKGGDPETFKWIKPAVDMLLLDENMCTFEGAIPPWAKIQLGRLAELRLDIATHPESRVIRVLLAGELRMFHDRHNEYVKVTRARRDEDAARYAKVVAEDVLLKRRYKGVVAARSRDRTRFPHMPKAVTCRHGLGLIQTEYLKVISTTRKRTAKGSDITDLVSKSDELLAKAHELVDRCCNEVHALVTSHGNRFPVLPASDPRASALSELNREQRRLTWRLRQNVQCDDIQDKLELLYEQVMVILKS